MNKSLLTKTLANTKWSELPEDLLTEVFFLLKEHKENPKPTCPVCGYNRFALFSSMNYKMCTKCYTKFDWKLKEGQKPMILHQR